MEGFELESASRRMRTAGKMLRQQRLSVLSRLRSIDLDSQFVSKVCAQKFNGLPIVPNLRNGLWYCDPDQKKTSSQVAYFKSTDGHEGEVSFHLSRSNMHIALLACASDYYIENSQQSGQAQSKDINTVTCLPETARGGIVLIDSTRFGKTFPDAFTRTVPVWCAIINTAVSMCLEENESKLNDWWKANQAVVFPSWVRQDKESQDLTEFVKEKAGSLLFESSLIFEIAKYLRYPLRPVWLCPLSPISTDVPDSILYEGHRDLIGADRDCHIYGIDDEYETRFFTPIVCFSVSVAGITELNTRMFRSWPYVQGAGDDEENWAQGLTAKLFWEHKGKLLMCENSQECESVIKNILEEHSKKSKRDGIPEKQTDFAINREECIGFVSREEIDQSESVLLVDIINDSKKDTLNILNDGKVAQLQCGNTKAERQYWLNKGFHIVLKLFLQSTANSGDVFIISCQDQDLLVILISLISLAFHGSGLLKRSSVVCKGDVLSISDLDINKENIRHKVLLVQSQVRSQVAPPRWMVKLLITFFTNRWKNG